MTAVGEARYWTIIFTPHAFAALAIHTCQHGDGPGLTVTCDRPAVYRAELDSKLDPTAPRGVTCWCAEHTALWRTAPHPPRLLSTLAAP